MTSQKTSPLPGLPALVLVVVCAALVSSMRVGAMAGDSGTLSPLVMVARTFELLTYIVILVAFHRRRPSVRTAFLVGVPFAVLYALLFFLQQAVTDAAINRALLYSGEMLFGMTEAILVMFFCTYFALYEPRICILLFVTQKVLANCFTMGISLISPNIVLYSRAIILVFCALGFSCAGFYLFRRKDDFEGLHFAGVVLNQGDNTLAVPNSKDTNSFSTPERCVSASAKTSVGTLDWVFLLCATALFRYSFGAISQFSAANASSLGLFSAAASIFALVTDLLLLIVLLLADRRFDLGTMIILVCPLYVFACVSYCLSGDSGNLLAGIFLRAGSDICFILAYALAGRMAYENPSGTLCFFASVALVNNTFPGRVIGVVVQKSGSAESFLALCVSILGLLTLLILVFAYFMRRGRRLGPERESTQGNSRIAARQSQSARGNDGGEYGELFLRAQEFSRNVQLSAREEEILMYLLQGYTREGIADKLRISPETVKSYTGRLYLKAGVNSKRELLARVSIESLPDARVEQSK